MQREPSASTCSAVTFPFLFDINLEPGTAVVKPTLVQTMEIICSPIWVLDQNRGESLFLQPTFELCDGIATEPFETTFGSPTFTLELDTAIHPGKDPAWIEIDCELPATSTVVSQVAIQTNARFVELYVDGNYLTTMKGMCADTTGCALMMFTHELHQRFSYSKLRLKFLSIKTNKLPTESKPTGLIELQLMQLSLTVVRQTEIQPKTESCSSTTTGSFLDEPLRTSSNCGMGQIDMSIGELLPPHLLSMRNQSKAPHAESLRGKTASVEEQQRSSPHIPAQQKNLYSEMAMMKTVLMADIAHLLDVKLAPLFTRMDLLQNRIEELVATKTAAEQLWMEKCSAVTVEPITMTDVSSDVAQRTANTVTLAAASNVIDPTHTILEDEPLREIPQNEGIPVRGIGVHSGSKGESMVDSAALHVSVVSTINEKPPKATQDVASVKEEEKEKDYESVEDQLSACTASSNDEDALKGDMRDLMRLLRGSHVLPITASSVQHLVDNPPVKIS